MEAEIIVLLLAGIEAEMAYEYVARYADVA